MPKRMRGNKTQRVPRTREQLVKEKYQLTKLLMPMEVLN